MESFFAICRISGEVYLPPHHLKFVGLSSGIVDKLSDIGEGSRTDLLNGVIGSVFDTFGF